MEVWGAKFHHAVLELSLTGPVILSWPLSEIWTLKSPVFWFFQYSGDKFLDHYCSTRFVFVFFRRAISLWQEGFGESILRLFLETRNSCQNIQTSSQRLASPRIWPGNKQIFLGLTHENCFMDGTLFWVGKIILDFLAGF